MSNKRWSRGAPSRGSHIKGKTKAPDRFLFSVGDEFTKNPRYHPRLRDTDNVRRPAPAASLLFTRNGARPSETTPKHILENTLRLGLPSEVHSRRLRPAFPASAGLCIGGGAVLFFVIGLGMMVYHSIKILFCQGIFNNLIKVFGRPEHLFQKGFRWGTEVKPLYAYSSTSTILMVIPHRSALAPRISIM